MTHILKHIALRLWASIALGVPVGLTILPAIQTRIGLAWVPLPAALVIAATFFFVGWVFNGMALALAERRIREAGVWERAGNPETAEKAYADAVAVFDSFLVSPRMRRRRSAWITSRLVRFYLARGESDVRTRRLVTDYVRARPQDREVAEAWLQRMSANPRGDLLDPEAAHGVAEAHADHAQIQRHLARLYLAAGRTDFSALSTYRRVLQQPGAAAGIPLALADLFLKEGRVDGLALEIYLRANAEKTEEEAYLRGMAACARWLEETPGSAAMLAEARRRVAHLSEDRLRRMCTGFVPPQTETPPSSRAVAASAAGAARMSAAAATRVFAVLAAAGRGFFNGLVRLVRSPRVRRAAIWAGVGLAGAGVLVFLVNTAGHLLRTRPGQEHVPVPSPAPVTDRFTIQVAAYLKQSQAEGFVRELREKKIDAFWAEASGKSQRWYQVRVHHFPDKAAARAYGESLKAKGIIDDFYVANYQRP